MIQRLTSYYQDKILPKLVHRVCSSRPFTAYRIQTVKDVEGKVLEIGIGSGLNLPYYSSKVQELTGIDPHIEQSRPLWSSSYKTHAFKLELMATSAESMPFDDHSFDHIVVTYSLCTIPNVADALAEMYRVLKPSGVLHFAEHGLAPDSYIKVVQYGIHPIWKGCGGGCHLIRNIPELIQNASFQIYELDESYFGRLPNIGYSYVGKAKK